MKEQLFSELKKSGKQWIFYVVGTDGEPWFPGIRVNMDSNFFGDEASQLSRFRKGIELYSKSPKFVFHHYDEALEHGEKTFGEGKYQVFTLPIS